MWSLTAPILALALVGGCGGCARKDAPPRAVDPSDAIRKLPPLLREHFDTAAGAKEMQHALEDKALLVAEARRQKLDEKPDVRNQVNALEERLIVKDLVAAELKGLQPDDAALRTYWQDHPAQFSEPERVRISRVFVAERGERSAARTRAEDLRQRMIANEPPASVAKDGDGAERVRGGDFGFVKRDDADLALVKAAFALKRAGDVSEVTETAGGFSVLVLVDRAQARVVPFEEAREQVKNRMQPILERRAFDKLVSQLREHAKAQR